MSLTDQEKLRGIVDDVVSGRLDEMKDEVEAKQEEMARKIEAMDAETKSQLEALVNAPAQKVDVTSPLSGKNYRFYRGYNLDRQGLSYEVKGLKQETKDMFARHVIDQLEHANRMAGWGIPFPDMTEEDEIQRAALAIGAAGTGGVLVPEPLADELLAYARVKSLALQKCRIWPMSATTLEIPGEDGTVTVAYTNEATAATQTEPTFTSVTLTASRLDAFSQMSDEVRQDANIDLISNLWEQYTQAIAKQLDNDLFQGTSPFVGIKTAASVNQVDMVTNDDAFSDIDAIYYSEMIGELPVERLGNPAFYFGRDIGHRTRSLSDTTGQLIWGQFASGEPATIFGYPYYITDQMPTTGATEMAVVFGDLNRVALGIRQGIEFMIDPYSLFTKSQIQTRVTMRVAMVVAQPNGLVRLFTAA